MGFFDRWLNKTPRSDAVESRALLAPMVVLHGHETLEVVGESHCQDDLWYLAGGFSVERSRCTVIAALVPEPDNPHDANAVKVTIEGRPVGYLSGEDAGLYLPGLRRLMALHEGWIALAGQIVGGGQGEGRLGMLGVFLDHDPADFAVHPRQISHIGELRTGLSQAVATDLEDDSYDLSWYGQLSGSHRPDDIVVLRRLLADERDRIERHFMLAELGKCLYTPRDDTPGHG